MEVHKALGGERVQKDVFGGMFDVRGSKLIQTRRKRDPGEDGTRIAVMREFARLNARPLWFGGNYRRLVNGWGAVHCTIRMSGV